MKAAIYARYSSENQRPESIEDQINSCRRFAKERGYTILEKQVYCDQATSGARRDRAGLNALMAQSEAEYFEIVLVDDLSRLARDNYLMLTIIAELRFRGVRVLSVADGLDSDDDEASLGIQIRGVFNELQLADLRKKTLRGQRGQKERGFFVGERTFGYKSVPVGTVRMDKKGRPRPEGYGMLVEPREAAIVLRIFDEFADGAAQSHIVKYLNEEGVPGRFQTAKGWSPATVSRILKNQKYIGRWVWNTTETRRDPKTGRRRKFPKSESEWIVTEDQNLRIVPQELWDRVQERLTAIKKTWPGGNTRGMQSQQGNRVRQYPTHLLAGAMTCGVCGATIAQVSGKSKGYYGCLGATKGACENRLLVRRVLTERVILDAVRERLATRDRLQHLLHSVEAEIRKLYANVPETIRVKNTEFETERRRVANFVEFIAEGRGSRALAEALAASERRAQELCAELDALRESRGAVFQAPPLPWVEERVARLQEVLERRTEKSGLLLRKVLGPIKLVPTQGDIGRPYYRAVTNLQVLALLEDFPDEPPSSGGSEGGSRPLRWWRRRESNPYEAVSLTQ